MQQLWSYSITIKYTNINRKIIHVRLNIFLGTNNCLYENQFGFRKHHSTNHVLIAITEKIRHTLDNNHYMRGVFLDFQKAFDTVNHDILSSKLHYYGIRDTPVKLIKLDLINGKQYTYINDTESIALISAHGVPQGSAYGPLLFFIYINDINKVIQYSVMHHFADDTNLLQSSNSLKQINKYVNHDLKLIVHWLQVNRISLNLDKTEIVIFRPKRKQITKKYELSNKRPKDNTQNTNQISTPSVR